MTNKNFNLGIKMKDVYRESFKEHGVTPAALGCPKGRQNVRFDALSRFIKPMEQVLDFGCGFADLSAYLQERGIDVNYSGCDVMGEFLDAAIKKRPSDHFFSINIGDKLQEKYDSIICSGVFNFKYCDDNELHEKMVFDTLEMLFGSCKRQISIDFLSPHVDYILSNSHHQNISRLIDFISGKLSRRYLIDHSYMPYEYAVHIFKEDTIERPSNVYFS
jgi:SAM-dependent methyltransferase